MVLALAVGACGGGSTSAFTDPGGGSSAPPAPGGGGTAAPSIDGLWSATSDNLGSTLALTLSSTGSAEIVVSGTGTYSVGTIRTGSVAVTGTYRPPSAVLTISYDHGEVVTFTTTAIDRERMKGKLTYRGGSTIDVEFARP